MKKLAIAAALASAVSPAIAQDQPANVGTTASSSKELVRGQVSKPNYVVGDWCEFKDRYGNLFRQTVTEKTESGYVMVAKGEVSPEEVRRYNLDHQLVAVDTRTFSPFWRSPTFPLRVGQHGPLDEFTYMVRSGKTTAKPELLPITLERVRVPAGELDTLMVKTIVKYTRGTGRQNEFHITHWWPIDPAIKWPVKYEFYDHGNRNSSSNRSYELVLCGNG